VPCNYDALKLSVLHYVTLHYITREKGGSGRKERERREGEEGGGIDFGLP